MSDIHFRMNSQYNLAKQVQMAFYKRKGTILVVKS